MDEVEDSRRNVHQSNKCPSCEKKLNAATAVFFPKVKPRDGDLSVCFYCGQLLRFDSVGILHKLEPEELKLLFDSERKELLSAKTKVLTYRRNG